MRVMIAHGTSAGYHQCMKLYGTPCKRCVQAMQDHENDLKKENKTKIINAKANIRQKAKTILSQRHKEEYLAIVSELEFVLVNEDMEDTYEHGEKDTSDQD